MGRPCPPHGAGRLSCVGLSCVGFSCVRPSCVRQKPRFVCDRSCSEDPSQQKSDSGTKLIFLDGNIPVTCIFVDSVGWERMLHSDLQRDPGVLHSFHCLRQNDGKLPTLCTWLPADCYMFLTPEQELTGDIPRAQIVTCSIYCE